MTSPWSPRRWAKPRPMGTQKQRISPPAPLGDPEDGSVPDATGEDATAGQRLSALSKMVPKVRPR